MKLKNELKALYKKDPKLAIEVAKVLGYNIKAKDKDKASIDEVLTYVSRNVFNMLSKAANSHGYVFKMSAAEFEKYLGKLLASKLR